MATYDDIPLANTVANIARRLPLMNTTTSTLNAYATFLTARWDEMEKAAQSVPPLGHNYNMGGTRQDEVFTFGRRLPSSMDGMGNVSECRDSPTTAAHFALHDPAYVLADLAAKRAVLREHAQVDPCAGTFGPDGAACPTLRHLAEPFRDHPDHPENQKPGTEA